MKQTSEKFMDEMLKDNIKESANIENDLINAEKLESMINKKLDVFAEKFSNEISKMMDSKNKEEVSTVDEVNEENESNNNDESEE